MKTTPSLLHLLAVPALLLAGGSPLRVAAQEPAPRGDPAALFNRLDANGDGQLSKDEFRKLATLGQGKFKDQPAVFDRIFEQLDADRSSALSQDEFNGLPKLRGGAPPATPAPTTTLTPAPATAGAKDYAHEIEKTPLKINTVPKLVVHDAKRNKDLQLRINYPEGKGPFPVILFSHGAWDSKDGYRTLTELWASHGYVTIQPSHSDSQALGNKVLDPTVFRGWQDRPADISFIIDSFALLETKEPALKAKLDAARIGMSGHSFGASTAELIGGARAYLLGQEKSFEDKRVAAVVLLSGQGPGDMMTEKSWEKVAMPMLVMTGSKDGPTRTGQPAEWRKKPYELSPKGDKFLVWVKELDHGFGGITGLKFPKWKENPDHVKYTKMATLAFWDAFLKGDAQAKAWLASDALASFSKGMAKLENK
jgi:predicted dienelactone hydrolase